MRLLLLAAIAAGQDLVSITKSLRRAFPEEPWTFLAIDLGAGVRDDDPVFGILDADDRWRGSDPSGRCVFRLLHPGYEYWQSALGRANIGAL